MKQPVRHHLLITILFFAGFLAVGSVAQAQFQENSLLDQQGVITITSDDRALLLHDPEVEEVVLEKSYDDFRVVVAFPDLEAFIKLTALDDLTIDLNTVEFYSWAEDGALRQNSTGHLDSLLTSTHQELCNGETLRGVTKISRTPVAIGIAPVSDDLQISDSQGAALESMISKSKPSRRQGCRFFVCAGICYIGSRSGWCSRIGTPPIICLCSARLPELGAPLTDLAGSN